MEERRIQFSPPDITQKEIDEVVDTLKSGWITTGPKTKLFEEEISKYCNSEKTVCLNSATAAMELVLRLFDVGPGDEVITSAYTYTASASVIVHCGATPVLVDVKPEEFNIDPKKIEEAITERTKVIIPVDIGGMPADYDEIFEIVERNKGKFNPKKGSYQEKLGRILVLADAAHSFGGMYKGKKVGSVADFTSYSFHAVKNLTTAEGGAITWKKNEVFNNEQIYKEFMLLALHGQNKDALSKMKAGAWKYDIAMPGYKCNMTDITAAMGLAQLSRYDDMMKKRKEYICMYDTAFKPLGIKVLKHYTKDHTSSGHLYMVRIPGIGCAVRNNIIIKLAERGIAANVHYKPLPMMSGYAAMGFEIKDYPNAYGVYENEITFPLHTCLEKEDVLYVIENMKEILDEIDRG